MPSTLKSGLLNSASPPLTWNWTMASTSPAAVAVTIVPLVVEEAPDAALERGLAAPPVGVAFERGAGRRVPAVDDNLNGPVPFGDVSSVVPLS